MRPNVFSKNRIVFFQFVFVIIFLIKLELCAQSSGDQTIGLFLNDLRAFNGYTLFAPNSNTTTYLIDNDGLLVHSWQSDYKPGQAVYLLENGNLLRTANVRNSTFTAGGSGGKVQLVEWDGNVAWDYLFSSTTYCQHHDVEILSNGNVLLIAWENKSGADAIAAGRNPGLLKEGALWPDYIVEVEPDGILGGNIVWQWHVWDHLIQDFDSSKPNYGELADHPELVDLNYVQNANNANADWNHTNSVAYNKEFDQIILSVHNFNEIWIIDHSTTTEEAASHEGGNSGKGGDLLYRWGNPIVYDAGEIGDRKLNGQHDSQWIKSGYPGAGNILVFNNGTGRNYSTVDEIVPPVDGLGNYSLVSGFAYGPAEQSWIYKAENSTDFYSQNISGAQRLSNGNTLDCSGANGIFFEVTPNKEIVWHYVNPVTDQGLLTQGETPVKNSVFKIKKYAPEYSGLDGRDLTPGKTIEINVTGVENSPELESLNLPEKFKLAQNYPNPFNPSTTIAFSLPSTNQVSLKVYNIAGQLMTTLVAQQLSQGYHEIMWQAAHMSSGIYYYTLTSGSHSEMKRMILLK
jgi:hypothetical protein